MYVRADATTADTLSGWQDLFLWGGTVHCDGVFGLDNGSCSPVVHLSDILGRSRRVRAGREHAVRLEVYFRDAANELRIWVDEIEVTPSGGPRSISRGRTDTPPWATALTTITSSHGAERYTT